MFNKIALNIYYTIVNKRNKMASKYYLIMPFV